MTLTPPPAIPSPWTSRRIIFLGVVGAILALSLTVGVRLMNAKVDEGDAGARDEKRVTDLQAIAERAQEIYESERVIPKTLEEIERKAKGRLSVADPQTFEVYEYNVLGGNRFEVCARFEEAASGGPGEHSAGRDCFQVTVE
jgi:hypothetical protein